MATQADVRRIVRSLPDTVEEDDRFAFAVLHRDKRKAIAWLWMERIEPKNPRVPRPDVVAIRVDGQAAKEELLAADPATFFTEPHYRGYPAVLVRLSAISVDELSELLTDAWRCQAPKALVKEYDARTR